MNVARTSKIPNIYTSKYLLLSNRSLDNHTKQKKLKINVATEQILRIGNTPKIFEQTPKKTDIVKKN